MGFVVDVVGYGGRPAPVKLDVQRRLAALVTEVLQDIGLGLKDTHHQGTGDGMVVFLPVQVEIHRVLPRVIRSTAELLAVDNGRYRDRWWIRQAAVV